MMMGEKVKNLVEDFNRKISGVQETLGKTKKTLYDEIDARLSALKGAGGNMDEVSKAL